MNLEPAFNTASLPILSPAEQVLVAMTSHVQDVIGRAFRRFPLDDEASAQARWETIGAALTRAMNALDTVIKTDFFDVTRRDYWLEEAEKANGKCDGADVGRFAAAFLWVYRRALEEL